MHVRSDCHLPQTTDMTKMHTNKSMLHLNLLFLSLSESLYYVCFKLYVDCLVWIVVSRKQQWLPPVKKYCCICSSTCRLKQMQRSKPWDHYLQCSHNTTVTWITHTASRYKSKTFALICHSVITHMKWLAAKNNHLYKIEHVRDLDTIMEVFHTIVIIMIFGNEMRILQD